MKREKHLVRGAVVWLHTDKHPFVVVSNNAANLHSKDIIVIPLSSKHKRMDLKTHAVVNYHDSMILAENIQSVDKKDIKKISHVLNKESMDRVDKCLAEALKLI